MCELLGISVSPAATMGVYFKEFRPRAAENPSGWGIGWYEDDAAHVMKEPLRADVSDACETLEAHPPKSHLFVIHVRAATIGSLTTENTHPFKATLYGREWLFAHNGTIKDPDQLDVGMFKQEGDTDSELAFHFLMTRLERLGETPSDEEIAAELLRGARELSARGRANILMTDGATLYAYHDGHKTLHYVEHRAEDLGDIRAEDEDYQIDLRLGDAPDERAIIIATVPLTHEAGWTKIVPGSFLAVRDGTVVQHVPPLESSITH